MRPTDAQGHERPSLAVPVSLPGASARLPEPDYFGLTAGFGLQKGSKIAAPEEVAFRQGFITAGELERLIAERYPKNDYGRYLTSVLRERS